MEPLDLSKGAPRGPHEKLDGLILLPRTIDKFRASLPGGVIGGYKIDGMSRRLLGWLGVDEAEMQAAVAAAASDDDVAKWVRTRTDASAYDTYNERMENRSLDDIEDKTNINKMYPWLAQSGLKKIFDIMEEDDRRTFGA